jgi:hypothetical protein
MTDGPAAPSAVSMARLAALLPAAFYLPPLLIYAGIIPFAYRHAVLVAVAAALALLAWHRSLPHLAQLMGRRALSRRAGSELDRDRPRPIGAREAFAQPLRMHPRLPLGATPARIFGWSESCE